MTTNRNGKKCSQINTCLPTTSLAMPSILVGATCNLPEAIIVEILSRVPVKSILRFRCVCKSWLSLFSDPNFIKLHCRQTSLDPKNHSLIACRAGKIALFNVNSMDNPVRYIMLPCQTLVLGVVGICSGMVCLSCYPQGEEMILWNPATHKYKTIKSLEWKKGKTRGRSISRHASTELSMKQCTLGFGLDIKEENFVCLKIVSMRWVNRELGVEVEIYFTSSGSWKKLQLSVPFNMTEFHNCAIVKGVPYWKAIMKGADDDKYRGVLLSFDVRNEEFNQLELPEIAHNRSHIYFVELNNSLASLVYHQGEGLCQSVDVWVLDDKKGWSRNFTVRPISTEMGGLVEFVTNTVVFPTDTIGSLPFYSEYQVVKSIHIKNGDYYLVEAHNYTESLVSVHGMKVVQRK